VRPIVISGSQTLSASDFGWESRKKSGSEYWSGFRFWLKSNWEFGSQFGSESGSDLDTDTHPVSDPDPDSDRSARAFSAIAQRLVCISLQVFVRCSDVPLKSCYSAYDPGISTFDSR